MPVTHVCFSVGFGSVSSFKALFKRNTAWTPAAWQKRSRQKAELSSTPFRFLPFFFLQKKAIFKTEKMT
jgi:AraC-like DNA-binding protein